VTDRGQPTLLPLLAGAPGLGAAASLLAAMAFVPLSLSCSDPVREHQIAALGGEAPGVPHGPLHRPGQPCGLCHGAAGPDSPEFSLSGTVYRGSSSHAPLYDATIRFIDSTGDQRTACSNSAGNFFVRSSDWSPIWPVWSKIEVADKATPQSKIVAEMTAAVFRETSCSTCHADPASPSAVGHLYFAEDETKIPEALCPCPCPE